LRASADQRPNPKNSFEAIVLGRRHAILGIRGKQERRAFLVLRRLLNIAELSALSSNLRFSLVTMPKQITHLAKRGRKECALSGTPLLVCSTSIRSPFDDRKSACGRRRAKGDLIKSPRLTGRSIDRYCWPLGSPLTQARVTCPKHSARIRWRRDISDESRVAWPHLLRRNGRRRAAPGANEWQALCKNRGFRTVDQPSSRTVQLG
jgi:hypothetical protein